jgi:hypothetical protein
VVEDYSSRALNFDTEIAVFLDEQCFKFHEANSPKGKAICNLRIPLGGMGIPYHVYLIDDFYKLMNKTNKYKSVLFACVPNTEKTNSAIKYCEENKIHYLKLTENKFEYTSSELRDIFTNVGFHSYTKSGDDVIYVGQGILALHASCGGEKTVRLPRKVNVKDSLESQKTIFTDTVSFEAKQFETKIFEIFE